MSNDNKDSSIWPVLIVIVVVGYAFYNGVWFGIASLILGLAFLGWDKRHEGPFPTDDDSK